MLNRTDFIAAIPVPVTDPSELLNEACSICTDSFTNPVSLPCNKKHIFCKECIVDWLERPDTNTCPMCRFACWSTMDMAVAMSGLTTGEFSTYNDDIKLDTLSLQHATDAAQSWLSNTTGVGGQILINKRRLGHDIIAMGNLLCGHAQAVGRPYSPNETAQWNMINDELYKAVAAREREEPRAIAFARQLSSKIKDNVDPAGKQHVSFFITGQAQNTPARDFRYLLCYIAIRAEQNGDLRRERLRAIEDEPSVIARVGMRLQDAFRGD